ncbi:sensor histidine kinase [Patulibacter americanus]|uniref:sensor histidine kinase n=1 Tax=Patulibacter americanus TaxID=588672 RepID=UPI0003B5DD05|nr:ATP-binding protein [Patulibacter americanus]
MSASVHPGPGSRQARLVGPAHRLRADPVAALALVLAGTVALTALGSLGHTLALSALLATTGVVVARALAVAWRRRVTIVGPAVGLSVYLLAAFLFARPSYGTWAQMLTHERMTMDKAFGGTVVTLALAAPVLVFAGTRRVAGWRRASVGTPWRSLVASPEPAAGGAGSGGRRSTGTEARRGAAEAATGALAALVIMMAYVSTESAQRGASVGTVVLSPVVGLLALVGAPALLALVVVGRRDRAERELAVHRQAVAAHLHDSVLQTFALIQRNLHDPERVRRLVRTQERELRTWLSGREVDALEATLAGALRATADLVEEEHGVTIEVEILDDADVLERDRPLLDATREALRNAARHGGGAAIRVLAERTGPPHPATVVYVRDDGPGFVPDAVAPERRGVRDSIVGRMEAAGGTARIDTAPGAGTEIVLTLPDEPREPR